VAEQLAAAHKRADQLAAAHADELAAAHAQLRGAVADAERADAAAQASTVRAEQLGSVLEAERDTRARERAELAAKLEAAKLEAAKLEAAKRETAAGEAATAASPSGDEADLRANEPSPLSWTPTAQLALTTALASASSWRTALKDALKIVGSTGGWDVAIAWSAEPRDARFACTAMWIREPDELAQFETATWQRAQTLAGSAIGRAAAAGHPAWIHELGTSRDAHLASAGREGMRCALLLPLRHGSATLGVLELCTRIDVEPGPDTELGLRAVAVQLAHCEQQFVAGEAPKWRVGRM
jgi:hypothetical protein